MGATGAGKATVERSQFSSRRPEEVVAFMRSRYVDHRPRLGRVSRDAEFVVTTAAVEALAVERGRITMNFETLTDPLPEPMPVVVLGGRLRVRAQDEDLHLQPGDCFLCRAGVAVEAGWHDFDGSYVRVPVQAITDAAVETSVIDRADFDFTSMRPVSAALERYFRGVAALASRELRAPDSSLTSPLVAAHLGRLVAQALVAAFPNTSMSAAYQPGPGSVAPAALRRARAFIESSCDQPISLSDIAAAARTSPRALQYAFLQHLDTSPMAHLRQVRLERAHRELESGDPGRGDTVEAIARRWGFANPGRFAGEYRRVYGHPPSQTLRG
jgi:AraC-like DNA-binding protein